MPKYLPEGSSFPEYSEKKLLMKSEQERSEGEVLHNVQAIQVLLDHSGLLISRTETTSWQAGRAPGCWAKTLFVEKETSIATSLIRMDPGTHFPRHRHAGAEEVFLLEGDLVVEGQKMKPGDYCRAETGSTHSESYTESGCVFLLKASQLDSSLNSWQDGRLSRSLHWTGFRTDTTPMRGRY